MLVGHESSLNKQCLHGDSLGNVASIYVDFIDSVNLISETMIP
jgi:hypothetical protein